MVGHQRLATYSQMVQKESCKSVTTEKKICIIENESYDKVARMVAQGRKMGMRIKRNGYI